MLIFPWIFVSSGVADDNHFSLSSGVLISRPVISYGGVGLGFLIDDLAVMLAIEIPFWISFRRFSNFSALRACHRPRDDGFAKFSRKFFENVGANFFFFEEQISSTRSIWSENRPNPSYPRDF